MILRSMMGKKSVGGTLFFSHLTTMGKKSVGYINQISTVLQEKKSVVHSFFPSVWWGKKLGVYSFSYLYDGEKESGAYSFSPSVRWRRTVGRNTLPKGSLNHCDSIA